MSSQRRPFSQATLDWFEEGELLENRSDQAPYEPFERVPVLTKLATLGASLAALGAAIWLLSLP